MPLQLPNLTHEPQRAEDDARRCEQFQAERARLLLWIWALSLMVLFLLLALLQHLFWVGRYHH